MQPCCGLEAGLRAGDGEGVQRLEHLAGRATTTAGETLQFGTLGIALVRPFGGGGGVATGFGDFGEEVVVRRKLSGNGAVFVGGQIEQCVSLSLFEIAELELDLGELNACHRFSGFVAEAGLVFQGHGQLPGFLIPSPGLAESALFHHARRL